MATSAMRIIEVAIPILAFILGLYVARNFIYRGSNRAISAKLVDFISYSLAISAFLSIYFQLGYSHQAFRSIFVQISDAESRDRVIDYLESDVKKLCSTLEKQENISSGMKNDCIKLNELIQISQPSSSSLREAFRLENVTQKMDTPEGQAIVSNFSYDAKSYNRSIRKYAFEDAKNMISKISFDLTFIFAILNVLAFCAGLGVFRRWFDYQSAKAQ